MKKFIAFLIVIFLFTTPAFAIEWYTANQASVSWDAVTTLADGSSLPSGDSIEYEVFLANSVTDPNKNNPVSVWTGITAQATITLGVEGTFFVGITAIRKNSQGVVVSKSDKAWSDDSKYASTPFGLRFYLMPSNVTKIRPQ